MLYRHRSKELQSKPIEYFVKEAQKATDAFRELKDFEHLKDLYFAVINLVLKESDFDPDLMDLIEKDIEMLFPHLN